MGNANFVLAKKVNENKNQINAIQSFRGRAPININNPKLILQTTEFMNAKNSNRTKNLSKGKIVGTPGNSKLCSKAVKEYLNTGWTLNQKLNFNNNQKRTFVPINEDKTAVSRAANFVKKSSGNLTSRRDKYHANDLNNHLSEESEMVMNERKYKMKNNQYSFYTKYLKDNRQTDRVYNGLKEVSNGACRPFNNDSDDFENRKKITLSLSNPNIKSKRQKNVGNFNQGYNTYFNLNSTTQG